MYQQTKINVKQSKTNKMEKVDNEFQFKVGHTYKIIGNGYSNHNLKIGKEFTVRKSHILEYNQNKLYKHVGFDLGSGAETNIIHISEVEEVQTKFNV